MNGAAELSAVPAPPSTPASAPQRGSFGYAPPFSIRVKECKRGGTDGQEGKLLAGDSGRKIAEVIDLQGAIYHGGW